LWSTEQILKEAKDKGIHSIQFQWIGVDGVIRSKASHLAFLENHMKSGIGVAAAIDAINLLDHLVPGSVYGAESSEFRIVPDPNTFSLIPYLPGNARFICDLYGTDMNPSPTDARSFLKRILEKTQASGYSVMAACEAEFSVFKRENGRIVPFFVEKYGAPNALALANDLIVEWVDSLTNMNVKVERFTKEYGPSQFEFQMRYDDALKAADDMLTLRIVAKGVASKHAVEATFLPKPTAYIGNGMHLHVSLWDVEKKRNLFYASNDRRGLHMSELGYHFVGGLLKHTKALCALVAPLVNSYKRLLDASWAPARVFYAGDHRDAAVRIPSLGSPTEEKSIHVEYRVPDSAANPYLALGATIAAGLDGIENKIDPGDPIRDRIYEMSEKEREKLGIGLASMLPRTLGEALSEMRQSRFLKELLGESMFKQYLMNREAEWKEFREHVTDWEVYNFIDSV
jgi:glutamine synthetase